MPHFPVLGLWDWHLKLEGQVERGRLIDLGFFVDNFDHVIPSAWDPPPPHQWAPIHLPKPIANNMPF